MAESQITRVPSQGDPDPYHEASLQRIEFLRQEYGFPRALARSINLDYDGPVTDDSTDEDLNSWAVVRLDSYILTKDCHDDELLYNFQDDFEGWTEASFDRLHKDIVKALRSELRRRGIYTGKRRVKFTRQLAQILELEDLPEWDAQELQKTNLLPGSRAAQRPQARPAEISQSRTTTPAPPGVRPEQLPASADKGKRVQFVPGHAPTTEPIEATTSRAAQVLRLPTPAVLPTIEEYDDAPQIRRTEFPTSHVFARDAPVTNRGRPATLSNQYDHDPRARVASLGPPEVPATVPPFLRPQLTPAPMIHAESLPPAELPNESIDHTNLVTFRKVWKEKDSYTGKLYDILDDRMRAFMSLCDALDIRPGQYAHVLRWALEGAAKDSYLHHVPEGIG